MLQLLRGMYSKEGEVRLFSFLTRSFVQYYSLMWGRGWCSGSASAVLSCIGAWQSDDEWYVAIRWWIHDCPTICTWQSDDLCMTVRRWIVYDSPRMIGMKATTQVTIYGCSSYVVRVRRVYVGVTKWCHRVVCYEGVGVYALSVHRLTWLTVVTLDAVEYYIVIWGYMTVLLGVNCIHDLYVSTWRLSGTLHDVLIHLRS